MIECPRWAVRWFEETGAEKFVDHYDVRWYHGDRQWKYWFKGGASMVLTTGSRHLTIKSKHGVGYYWNDQLDIQPVDWLGIVLEGA